MCLYSRAVGYLASMYLLFLLLHALNVACLMQRDFFMLDVRMWTSTRWQLTKIRTSECQQVLVINKADAQLVI